ncbi:hypothetical protein F511_38625 [Dorcoceras hygrometricum]|uniref:Uncharacterized protein n=1 Tax=Dorcoceras hygrometricum TaxID=472368 RepID=A0A2Z7DAK7_9LAMI|nr:hypothetical protein F511_38625 [Dorcoceras hygrometricum]
MEWAAGLAMETSKVESAVRNQAEAKLNQLEHDEPAETMNQLQALKRKDEPDVAIISTVDESINSRYPRSKKKKNRKLELERRRKSAGVLSVDDIKCDVIIQQEATQSQATVDSVATQRFPVAVFVIQTQEDKSIIKEDSGEAIDEPDASNSSIQSKSLYESAVATQPVSSFASRRKVSIPVQARRRKTHVYVVSHTVEAVVHLRSLGVLTAAGCGIGSVHAVVRSNLLVEPSKQAFTLARYTHKQTSARTHNKSALALYLASHCIQQHTSTFCVVLGTKKTISSNYICPADGSQYYQSAVGLVFMEWAAGLAMETSKVESAVRNQAEAKLNQLEHDEPAETMNQLQALKRKDEPDVAIISTVDESINSRYPRSKKKKNRKLELERRRKSAGVRSADGLVLMTSSVTSSYSADDLSEQSQQQVACTSRRKRKRRRRGGNPVASYCSSADSIWR